MKKFILLSTLCLSLLASADTLKQVQHLHKSGKTIEALEIINKLIKAEPNKIENIAARCDINTSLEMWDEVLEDMSALIALAPESGYLYLRRAAIYQFTQKYELAIEDYRTAQKLEKDKLKLSILIIELFLMQPDKINDAIVECTKILYINQKEKNVLFTRGYLWAVTGSLNNAYRDLKLVTEIDPKGVDAFNALAWWLSTYPNSQFRNGKVAVQYALKACDNSAWTNAKVIDTLAAAYAELDDFTAAKKEINKALALSTNDANTIAELKKHLAVFEQNKKIRELPSL